jgi:hypothetical protein
VECIEEASACRREVRAEAIARPQIATVTLTNGLYHSNMQYII